MATQLNPGADQTLVAAATRAAMANVPLDHSKAYAALAQGYGKFAQGMLAMYAPIARGVGEAVKPLVDKVKEKIGDNLEELWLNVNMPFHEVGKDYDFEEIQYDELDQNILGFDPDLSSEQRGVKSANIEALQNQIREIDPTALPNWGIDGKLGDETEEAIKNILKEKEELQKSEPYIKQEIELNKERIEHWEKEGKYKFADRFRKRNIELESQIIPTIKAGGVYTHTNDRNQTTNISIVGQDDYIHRLGDETKEILKQFDDGDITLAEKDDLIGRVNNKIRNAENSTKAFSKEQVRVMNLINEGNFNPMASGAMNMEFINAVIERGRSAPDGSRVVRGYDDDGNVVLMWVDKYGRAKKDPMTGNSWVVTQGEMKKFIVEKDTESEVAITKHITTDQQKLGASGLAFNGQEVANNITKICSNEKTFLDMINTSLADNTGTFREHVYGAKKDENGNWTLDPTKLGEDMYAQLSMLGGRFDADNDGDVDAQDFVTDENKAELANYLTSYNPTSVNAFANFMKNTAERYHSQGITVTKKGTKTDKKTTSKLFKDKMNIQENWFNPSQLDNIRKYVTGGTSFKLGRGDNQNTYTFDEGSWWKNKGSEAEVEIGDAESLIFNEFGATAGSHPGFQGLETASSWTESKEIVQELDNKSYRSIPTRQKSHVDAELRRMLNSKEGKIKKGLFYAAIKTYTDGEITFSQLQIVNQYLDGKIKKADAEKQTGLKL